MTGGPKRAVLALAVAAMGVVLARVAGAGDDAGSPAPVPAAPSAKSSADAVPSGTSAASGASSSDSAPPAHDEESAEPHAPIEENPYGEPTPKPATAHQPFVLRDGMVRLPGGHFVMGSSSPRARANERPARSVEVAPFWIDRTEVTVGAYRACVEAGACARPVRTAASCTYDVGDPKLPVSCVHWRDADAYCRFAGKRLPNEREWEFAARGSSPAPFPWGSGIGCQVAVTLLSDQSGRSCARHPVRVGSHPGNASPFGVLDLSGNVEEWTADWYADSLGPGSAPRAGAAHVLRGGGWLSAPSMSRTTSRNWGSAVEAGPNVGFRCARSDG